MTILELQPHVDAALVSLEWELARARWRQGLLGEIEAIENALPLAGQFGVELEPLCARLDQITNELKGDVTADQVPVHPLRSVPMDMITVAVVRRILRLPAEFPILSIKALPSEQAISEAVVAIADRWHHPNGPTVEPTGNLVSGLL